jgi:hypothetical protein
VNGAHTHDEAPRATVTRELLELFRHPQPDDAAERISQTERLLEQVVRNSTHDPESIITQAKNAIEGLADETCNLVRKRGGRERKIRVIRGAANTLAVASLGAAVAELQKHAWQVAPDVLREAAELIQLAGHSLDSLPLLGLMTVVGMQQVAERTRQEAAHLPEVGHVIDAVRPVAIDQRPERLPEEPERTLRPDIAREVAANRDSGPTRFRQNLAAAMRDIDAAVEEFEASGQQDLETLSSTRQTRRAVLLAREAEERLRQARDETVPRPD